MSVATATMQIYENFSNKRSCELLFLQKYDIFCFKKSLLTFFSTSIQDRSRTLTKFDGELQFSFRNRRFHIASRKIQNSF